MQASSASAAAPSGDTHLGLSSRDKFTRPAAGPGHAGWPERGDILSHIPKGHYYLPAARAASRTTTALRRRRYRSSLLQRAVGPTRAAKEERPRR
jgi:hypothetical protein